jgi:signal peptidase I
MLTELTYHYHGPLLNSTNVMGNVESKKERQISVWARLRAWLADTGKQLGIAIVIVMFLRSSIIEPYKIPSGSMIPTLFIGDHIFVNKFSYGFKVPFTEFFLDKPLFVTEEKLPSRGDVIVFKFPKDPTINYIKRVVGLPGDRIQIRDKVLYVNGEEIKATKLLDTRPEEGKTLLEGLETDDDKRTLTLYEEDLLGVKHPVLYNNATLMNSDYQERTVPNGMLLCLGDNRDKSSDSRFWGFVPLENIKGKAMFVWLNFSFTMQDQFDIDFRIGRIGTLIR